MDVLIAIGYIIVLTLAIGLPVLCVMALLDRRKW